MKPDAIAVRSIVDAGPWAIDSDRFSRYLAGVFQAADPAADLFADADPGEVEAMYAARGTGSRSGTVAVVPVLGPITKRDSLFTMLFGGTSTVRLSQQLRALAADDSVATILLNVDSPGGTVSGLPELVSEVRRVAETKRVVAIANDLAASAAYWIASQADEVIATPEALVGSVGVFTQHVDFSAALEREGIRVSFIQAGKYKTEGNPFEPLTDEARAHVQSIVDATYAQFVGDVAKGRNTTPAAVRADYGEGRVLTAKDAKAAGMVDRVETYSQAVARLSGVKPAGLRVDADILGLDGSEVGMVEQQAAAQAGLSLELDEHDWLLNS